MIAGAISGLQMETRWVPLEDLKTNRERKTGLVRGIMDGTRSMSHFQRGLSGMGISDGNKEVVPRKFLEQKKEARGMNCRVESTHFREEAFAPGGWNKPAANGWDPEGNSV